MCFLITLKNIAHIITTALKKIYIYIYTYIYIYKYIYYIYIYIYIYIYTHKNILRSSDE